MSSTAYDSARHIAWREANRTVVGITAARQRQDLPGARHLLLSYFETCRDLGLCHEASWAVLFNAGTEWLGAAVGELAATSGTDSADLLTQMAAQAAARIPS